MVASSKRVAMGVYAVGARVTAVSRRWSGRLGLRLGLQCWHQMTRPLIALAITLTAIVVLLVVVADLPIEALGVGVLTGAAVYFWRSRHRGAVPASTPKRDEPPDRERDTP